MDTFDDSYSADEDRAEIAECQEIIKTQPDDPGTYYRWRMALAALGFPEDETAEYLRTIEQNLNTPEAYNEIAFLLSDYEQDEQALQVFQKTLELDPGNFYALFNSGISFHKLKKYDEAIEQYRKALESEPASAIVYDGLGRAYHNLERYEEAAENYKKALSFNPNDVDVLYNYGLALYNQEKYEEAIDQFQQATATNHDFINGYIEWGRSLERLDRHEEAIDKYRLALQRDDNNPTAHNNLGIAYFDLGQYEEAIEEYEKALQTDFEYAHLYHRNLGLALEKLGRFEEAAENYQQAVLANSEYVDAYNSWGLVLDRLGLQEEAIEKYQKALQTGDSDTAIIAATHNRMGIAFYNLGRHHEALEQYNKALKIDPEYAHVYYHNQGLVFERQTKYEQALDEYEKALQANPEYVAAFNSLGIALEQLGRIEDALEQYDKALAIDHDQKEFTLFNKSLALEKLSRYDAAVESYKKAYALNTDYPYPAHNIASIRERAGLLEKSAKWWEKACAAYERNSDEARKNHDVHHFYNHARVYHYSFDVDFEKARSIYSQGLDIDPENISILFGLARLYQDLKNQEIAYRQDEFSSEIKAKGHWKSKEYLGTLKKLLEKQVEDQPDEVNLSQLGEVYFLMGENYYTQATDYLGQALAIQDNLSRAAELLGIIHLHKNRPKKAIDYFVQEQGVSPDDLNIRSMEADACRMAKIGDRAEAIYREILEINRSHFDALAGLAGVHVLKGERNLQNKETELAEENFTQAVDLYTQARGINDAYQTHLHNGLNVKRMAALLYSHGYAKIRLYEALPARNKNKEYLKDAIRDFNKITNSYPNSVYKYRADSIRKKISRHLQPGEDRATRVGARLIFIFACTVFLIAQFSFFFGQPVFSPAYVFTENKLQEAVATAGQKDITITKEIQDMLANLSKNQYSSLVDFDSQVNSKFETLSKTEDPAVRDGIAFIKNELTAAKVLQNRGSLRFVDFAPITSANYALISFGALLFMAAALYLPEITRIRVPGLELEKAPTEQISTSSSLVLRREFSKMEPGSSSPSIQKMRI